MFLTLDFSEFITYKNNLLMRRKKANLKPLLILIIALSVVPVFATVSPYNNPVIATTGPADPSIMQYNGTYYLYPTQTSTNYQVWTSTNLVSFTKGNTVWAGASSLVWAPDVKYDAASGKFVMYATDNYQIKCATATSPTTKNAFTTVSSFASISGLDACLYIDNDGKYYLYYSQNAKIYCKPLLSATSHTPGNEKIVIKYTGTTENENATIIEGPYVIRYHDTYYMIYSCGNYNNPNYHTNYATAKSPMGPWIKNIPSLMVSNTGLGIYGPGHGCLIQDAAGIYWHMYQQLSTATSGTRQLAIDPLVFNADGTLTCTGTRGTSQATGPTTFAANPLPTSVLLTPTDGTVVSVGTSVPMTAAATDNGSISKVEYWVDDLLVGSSVSATTYAYNWTATAGVHWVEARTYDNTGAITRSQGTKLIVGNQPPTVSFITPYHDANLPLGAKELLLVNAADPDGSIARVDFYENGVLLGSAISAPYELTYTVPNKTYIVLKAVAVDNNGLSSSHQIAVYALPQSGQFQNDAVVTIPGIVQAENFDQGGLNVAWYKSAPISSGTTNYRSDLVNINWIDQVSNTRSVGSFLDNDWYEYSLNVSTAGMYSLNLNMISTNTQQLLFSMDGMDISNGLQNVPSTGGVWKINTIAVNVPSAGKHILHISVKNPTSDFQLDYLLFTSPYAPTAPSNLVASNITQTGFNLSWAASVDNRSVAGYDAYNGSTLIGSVDGNSTTMNVTGVKSGTVFNIVVIAKDDEGNVSTPSNKIATSTLTSTDNILPIPPTTILATDINSVSFILNWSGATDNVGIDGYDVYKNGSLCGSTTSTNFAVTGLTENTAYIITIITKDLAGNLSAASQSTTVTTVAGPAKVHIEAETASISATDGSINSVNSGTYISNFYDKDVLTYSGVNLSGQTKITLYAASQYVSAFYVEVHLDSPTGTLLGTIMPVATGSSTVYQQFTGTLSHVPTGLNTLVLVGSGGDPYGAIILDWIELSGGVILTPDTNSPTSPTNLSASLINSNGFTLNWSGSTDDVGVVGYQIFNGNTLIGSSTGSATTLEVRGLANNTAYNITIKALDAASNTSTASSMLIVNTIAAGISVPNELNEHVLIYPNPAKSFITVKCENGIIRVYGIDGTLFTCKKIENGSASFQVNCWEKGLYLFNIQTSNLSIIKKVLVG